jgi:hypothetical protein
LAPPDRATVAAPAMKITATSAAADTIRHRVCVGHQRRRRRWAHSRTVVASTVAQDGSGAGGWADGAGPGPGPPDGRSGPGRIAGSGDRDWPGGRFAGAGGTGGRGGGTGGRGGGTGGLNGSGGLYGSGGLVPLDGIGRLPCLVGTDGRDPSGGTDRLGSLGGADLLAGWPS